MSNPNVLEEYRNISVFIRTKYGIEIDANEDLSKLAYAGLNLLSTLKIWNKYISSDEKIFKGAKNYFDEIISNTIHAMILAFLDLKIPSLIMLRRSQENILTFLYYSQHPVEFYKKEIDGQSKNLNGFKELKDYISSYPFISKYNDINNQNLQRFCSEILIKWTEQYQNLSNYVHGSNTKYLENTQFFDEFKFNKGDTRFITKNIEGFSSIINTLLIVFYFDVYSKFNDENEKSPIRCGIQNGFCFKSKIVEIFHEI